MRETVFASFPPSLMPLASQQCRDIEEGLGERELGRDGDGTVKLHLAQAWKAATRGASLQSFTFS
jgi:hypothetical protein